MLKRKSLGLSWLAPFRYSGELSLTDPEKMIQMFLDKFSLYPKRLYWTERNELDLVFRKFDIRKFDICQIFQDFLSHSLEPLWFAVGHCKPSTLKSLSFSACVTNLGHLISNAEYFLSKKTRFTNYGEHESDVDYSMVHIIEFLV